jgi:hypothetical protein
MNLTLGQLILVIATVVGLYIISAIVGRFIETNKICHDNIEFCSAMLDEASGYILTDLDFIMKSNYGEREACIDNSEWKDPKDLDYKTLYRREWDAIYLSTYQFVLFYLTSQLPMMLSSANSERRIMHIEDYAFSSAFVWRNRVRRNRILVRAITNNFSDIEICRNNGNYNESKEYLTFNPYMLQGWTMDTVKNQIQIIDRKRLVEILDFAKEIRKKELEKDGC